MIATIVLVLFVYPAHAVRGADAAYVPNVVVVHLAGSTSAADLAKAASLQPAARLGSAGSYSFTITDGTSVPAEVARLRGTRGVASAEPDWILRSPETASALHLAADPKAIGADPYYLQQTYLGQWSLPWIGLTPVRQEGDTSGVTVAVVDTGVQMDHPALDGKLIPGYDFVDGTASVTDPVGGAESGHGTFIAGLIALVAPAARIMPIRVLDTSGMGDEITVARGIYFAVQHGADIINLSLGSYAVPTMVDDAVTFARQHGVLVVASTGNDNSSEPQYPAAVAGTIGVAATDPTDHKATFSNFGTYVSISAPGTDHYSDYPGSRYAFGAGTSFAAALTTGVAALEWGMHSDLTASDVATALRSSATPIDSLNPGYAGALGSGRLNAGPLAGGTEDGADTGASPGSGS